jgi:dihydropteroate synthase
MVARICRERGTALMGVLNVTPDSFSDGGLYLAESSQRQRIDELIRDGADIIDIGAESTRPGAAAVSASEQIARMEGAVRYAVERGGALVSVDTSSPEVADRMLPLGAELVNDVSCLRASELAAVTALHGAALVLMHSRGPMTEMKGFGAYPESGYRDVVEDVRREWRAARDRAVAAGMAPEQVFFDPGLGFNKSARHSIELLRRLAEFQSEDVPIVVGPSRKSFIASVDDAPPSERLGGTIAACLAAVERGASILRVHDVQPVRQALAVARAVAGSRESAEDARNVPRQEAHRA